MKHLSFAVVICSVALVLVSARTLFAGVVMAETSTATGPDCQTNSQVKTIYLQGNKQRVDKQDIAAITDLDKSVIYIIDKQHRAYTEMPLRALSSSLAGNGREQSIKLDRTGKTRIVANHPCEEYRASGGDRLEHVTIRACVSTSAPGAREISEFERKMITRISGQQPKLSSGHQPAALMLEKQSVLNIRIPDPSQHRPYRTASLLAETRVNQIELKPLPPETFKPPKGFNRLQNHSHEAVPPASPDAAGPAIEVISLTPSSEDRASKL